MNGEPLSAMHGFPIRVLVSGYIGARSVKWLEEITVQTQPSANYFQSHAYKSFPPDIRAETADWRKGLTLENVPVNAVITRPLEGEILKQKRFLIQGYAISGGQSIERVEFSFDEGKTWITAKLLGASDPWSWRFWEEEVDLLPGIVRIWARAWDSAAQTQPEDPNKIWNFKGYVNNAWHRITCRVAI
jgi:sulfite oxidase